MPLRRIFNRSLVALLVAVSLLSGTGTALAQTPAPQGSAAEALNREGDIFFERRQYKEAIASYVKLIQGYPNSELITEARFHLAYASFLTSQFDPAANDLRRLIAAPTTPPELLEQAALLLPQVLSQWAASLKPDDPAREARFGEAIHEFDAFVNRFSKSADLETARYGRAVAAYQVARYADATRDLSQNVATFPNSDTVLDSTFLLSLTLATQANLALAKENHTPTEADGALKNYAESERLLDDIIRKRTDISLANDAQFQLGETLMAHANASPEAARKALYERALAAYRAVEPKAGMIAAQEATVRRYSEQRIAELRRGPAADRPRARRLDQLRLHEQGKLEELQAKDDPVVTARVKGGAVYCALQRYDEARVLMNALLPSIKRADDDKLALKFVTLSYAGQQLTDQAVAAYDRFQTKYKGDPEGEALPFFMGVMFQGGDKPDPARANRYFDELAKNYPQSRLRETALLQQANNFSASGRFEEALKAVDTFLAGKPKRELVATGELTRARIIKDKKSFGDALTAFKKVRDAYQDLPEGEEAAYWVGWTLLQQKDAAGATVELQAFLDKRAKSRLAPAAMLALAQAQQAANARDQALATLADVSARFPDAPEATSAYFARANLYLGDKKFDDMVRVLTEFVDKQPDSEQAAAAYEQIAAVQAQAKQFDAAAATYEKFLSKGDSPEAPGVLGKLAALWQRAARGMGTFVVLGAPQRETWTADLAKSIAASERQLERYPDAPATALGLQNLAECQRLLLEAKVRTPEQVAAYFQKLADKYQDKPAARSRVLFRLAALTAEKDPTRALAEMRAAYDPAVVYSPADLDQYTRGLLAVDLGAAGAVFDKAAADYPLPAGVSPAQAPADVQEAQALALYGRGKLAAAKGDSAGAERAFTALRKDYPRSNKSPEANLGLAENLVAQGKGDEAMPLLAQVAKTTTAPLDVRARGLFLNGEIQAKKGNFEAADAYLKVAAFYPTSPDAPEGLWKGGQMLEQQAATLGDTPAKPGAPTKAGQLARARKAYEDLVSKYAGSKWTDQAKARVAALPAVK